MRIHWNRYYLKDQKATSPSKRFQRKLNKILSRKTLEKKFNISNKKTSGRGCNGHIIFWHRGGGHKQIEQQITFKNTVNAYHKLVHIQYSPSRTSLIGLFLSSYGTCSYRLLPKDLMLGQMIRTYSYYFLGTDAFKLEKKALSVYLKPDELSRGDTLPLLLYPNGTIIHNIELYPGQGGQLLRSAGSKGKLLTRLQNGFVLVRLSTKEIRYINCRAHATLGQSSNQWYKETVFGKAGLMRWLNIRPTVRGVATNPIDHLIGRGQGQGCGKDQAPKAGKGAALTPWGALTRGPRTRVHKVRFIKRTRRYNPSQKYEK